MKRTKRPPRIPTYRLHRPSGQAVVTLGGRDHAGLAKKDHVRAAIQMLSTEVASRTVYTHTGWREIEGNWVYLHANGALGRDGQVFGAEVELPELILGYALPGPPEPETWRHALRASLAILDLGPPQVMYPIVCAVWRSAITACASTLHVVGQTGVFKSQLVALAAPHFGHTMNSENLPGSWSSTNNALEGSCSS